ANLAQGEPHGSSLRLTTKSLVEAGIDVGADEARAPRAPSADELAPLPADHAPVSAPPRDAEAPLSPAWQEAWDDAFDETERKIIGLVSQYDVEPPVVGDEHGTGVPLEIAWPGRKIGVTTGDLDARDRASLEQDGWSIVGPDPETVLAALQLTSGGDS